MGYGQGKGRNGSQAGSRGSGGANKSPPFSPDRNVARRQQYAVDPEYAGRQRELARQSYRTKAQVAPRLPSGLQTQGELREVTTEDAEYPHVVEAFTLPEAARALGRTELTLKRWIEDDLIPAPILRDTTKNYRQYSVGELRIIAEELREHEREGCTYYLTTHTQRRERIMQHIFAFRQHHI